MKKNILLFSFLILVCLIIVLVFNNANATAIGSLIKVSYAEIQEMVDEEKDFILVVSQSTCSHCATYKPKLKEIAEDYSINIYYIDYDNENSNDQKVFLNEFKLSGATPTTMFIKDGNEVSVLSRLEGDFGVSKVVKQFKKMGFIDE